MRLRRIRLLIVLVVLALASVTLAGSSGDGVAAGDGTVQALPEDAHVYPGDTVPVSVVVDPPAGMLSIWIIKVSYDPNVIQPQAGSCLGATLPPTGVGASTCLLQDQNFDIVPDTLVFLGGYVVSVGGIAHGLSGPTTLGSAVMVAVGPPGSQSPLTVEVVSFVTPDSLEPTPDIIDGLVSILDPLAVGGTVALMTASPDSEAPPYALVALALIPALAATAWLLRRRIMRR